MFGIETKKNKGDRLHKSVPRQLLFHVLACNKPLTESIREGAEVRNGGVVPKRTMSHPQVATRDTESLETTAVIQGVYV